MEAHVQKLMQNSYAQTPNQQQCQKGGMNDCRGLLVDLVSRSIILGHRLGEAVILGTELD